MIIDPYSWYAVRVIDIVRESPDAVSVYVEKPSDYTFAPGQHAIVRIELPDGTKRLRQYSYADRPQATRLKFTITRSPDGEVSSWFIDKCTPTSTIEITQAFVGPLQIDPRSFHHIGMLAGGSGIAPMLAHLQELRDITPTQKRTLLYSTHTSSRCAADVLQPLDNEVITVRLSDVDGRLTRTEIIESLRSCDLILLCGSRQFVTAVLDICHHSLPDTTILAEAFSLT